MKKFLILIAALLCVTGCFEKNVDPKTEVMNAEAKMDALDSYSMTMDMSMKFSGDSFSVDVNMDMNMDVDVKNKISKMEMTFKVLGEEVVTEGYVKYDDEKVIAYTKQEDDWYYEETDLTAGFEFDIFKNINDIKEVQYDGNGKKYQIALSKEDIEKIFDSISEMEEMEGTINFDEVELFVYIENGYITQIDMNFPITVTESDINLTANANVIYKLSKFNEVAPIVIPDEVLNEAIDQEEALKRAEIESYAYSYLLEVFYQMPSTGNFTDNTIEYDGPQPTLVDLTIKDYSVNGKMIIEGYIVNFVDDEIESIEKAN